MATESIFRVEVLDAKDLERLMELWEEHLAEQKEKADSNDSK